MEIISPEEPRAIRRVSQLLQQGELVALPTETVYGLAADAFNPRAVRSIFEVKGRPLIDPLIVHFHHLEQLETLTTRSQDPRLHILARHCWPGPLTLVLLRDKKIPDLVTAGHDTVAVRMPAHPLLRAVLAESQLTIAAPSANPFGYISPTTIAHVEASLGDRIGFGLDGGPCSHGIESTILSLADPSTPELLRPGPISRETLEELLACPVGVRARSNTFIDAPGLLPHHYAPRKPFYLFDSGSAPRNAADSEARIYLKRPPRPRPNTYWLSEDGSMETVARHLFATMRQLDEIVSITAIWCEKPPADGIGTAILDRMQRAAHRSVS